MKDFFKMLAASILGCAIILFAGTMLIFGTLAAMLSLGASEIKIIPQNAILKITFEKPVLEQTSTNPVSKFIPFGLYEDDGYGYYEWISAVDRAAEDPRIQMIYLNTNYLSAGIAQIEEMREALKRFRLSGKAVIAYADSYSQAGYYLASVADKVYLNPNGQVGLRGFAVSTRYYKGLMDELGVEAQFIRHGTYKSGGEPYIQANMSAEERIQVAAYLQSIWNHWASEIAQARRIGVQTVDQTATRAGFTDPLEAVDNQFIDELFYKDQLIDYFCKLQDVKRENALRVVDMSRYIDSKPLNRTKDKIAVLFAHGTLYTGTGQQDIMSENHIRIIRKLRADSSVKAVVLRVDSPGGDVAAAASLHRELRLLKEVKPLIVSMGDNAASGGYWISCAADHILATPVSMTGSIGVYALAWNGQKGVNKWLKVNVETVRTHSSSDVGSIYRPMNATELQRIQREIDKTYLQFTATVSQDRGLPPQTVDALAQGRIWSGEDAVKNGLIDQTGGLYDAIRYAAQSANLYQYQVVEYPAANTLIERIMQSAQAQSAVRTLGADPQKWAEEIEATIRRASEQGVQAKVPYLYHLDF